MFLLLFDKTHTLCEALQHREMDVATAKELTEATILELISLRNEDEFKVLFKSSCELAKSLQIDCPIINKDAPREPRPRMKR
jgi:hypothetical protein